VTSVGAGDGVSVGVGTGVAVGVGVNVAVGKGVAVGRGVWVGIAVGSGLGLGSEAGSTPGVAVLAQEISRAMITTGTLFKRFIPSPPISLVSRIVPLESYVSIT
jgi:hypothetical protein